MKHVNHLEISLSKDMTVHKNGVTPVEALLLTAEHHRNVGGRVFDAEIADKNATEIADPVFGEDGKQKVDDKGKGVTTSRTDDQELQRLRMKYGPHKVKAILSEVRTLPSDFKTAAERGTQIVLPSSPLSQTRLV